MSVVKCMYLEAPYGVEPEEYLTSQIKQHKGNKLLSLSAS